jgi:predicted phosphoribosyltransferase
MQLRAHAGRPDVLVVALPRGGEWIEVADPAVCAKLRSQVDEAGCLVTPRPLLQGFETRRLLLTELPPGRRLERTAEWEAAEPPEACPWGV